MRKFILPCSIMLLALVLIGLITAVIVFVTGSDEDIANTLNSGKCTEENTTFTYSPVELEKLANIVPLGNLNPSGHTFPTVHMYYFLDSKSNVYAPIDAEIETMSVMTRTDLEAEQTDYSIDFRTCEDFTFYFIHVKSLSEKLQKIVDENLREENCDEYTTGGQSYRNCWLGDIKGSIKAGEVLGTAGSDTEHFALDFGTMDYRIEPHTFANPVRWIENNREDIFYRVCSTDYYVGELKATLENQLGDFRGESRTVSPFCGTNAQDVPGTAQGVWFLEGSDKGINSEDPHIALVHDNFDPTKGVFSNGTSLEQIGIGVGTYYFTPAKTGTVNLDFNLVKPGSEVYCYEVGGSFSSQDNSFSILLQMPTEETIRIGKWDSSDCGEGPRTINESVTFER